MTTETYKPLPEDHPDAIDTSGEALTPNRKALIVRDDEETQERLGRKLVPIDWARVETAMSFGADLRTCAAFGGCHWNTLERRVKDRYGANFKEVRDYFMADKKALALTQAWKAVQRGEWKAIEWANKIFNGLGKATKTGGEGEDDGGQDDFTFNLNYSLDEHPDAIEAEFKSQEEV